MKNIIIIGLMALFMLSATVIEVTQMVVQPKLPTSVKVMSGYVSNSYGDNTKSIESALNTYKNIGYIVKSSSYDNNQYFIILEKY